MDVALLFLPLIGGFIFSKSWVVTNSLVRGRMVIDCIFVLAFMQVFLFTFAVLIRLLLRDEHSIIAIWKIWLSK